MSGTGSTNVTGLPLLGKTAIVTGAARGIGAAIAYRLASDGANVFLGYTSESSAARVEEVIKRIRALPNQPEAHAIQADLGQLNGPEKFMDQVKTIASASGGELKLDILVNNAGMAGIKALADVTPEFYDQIFGINVRAALFLMKEVQPFLQPKGRIINISSVAARHGRPNETVYGASKAALEGLTRTSAAELGFNGTTVNAVSPGPTPSDMLDSHVPAELLKDVMKRTPIEGRIATEEEIPNIVAWLASPAASWITGQCINATGGLQMV